MDKKLKEVMRRIKPEVRELLRPSIQRLAQNLGRADNLVQVYNDLFGKKKGRKSVHAADVLRTAVVFIHASLEDFLRSLAAAHLPRASESALNDIPLMGLNSLGRPEKFYLGKLGTHRGKTVDQVIEESIANFLERSNYNNTQDIALLLSTIGIDVSKVNQTFPVLDQMMRRRHQIVHRADRVDRLGKGLQYAQSISAAQVANWIKATKEFMTEVLIHTLVFDEGFRARLQGKGILVVEDESAGKA